MEQESAGIEYPRLPAKGFGQFFACEMHEHLVGIDAIEFSLGFQCERVEL